MINEVALNGMNIFQLRALSSAINSRIIAVAGAPSIPPTVPRSEARSAFKYGDLIEFDAKGRGLIRATINRLNDKTIGCVDVATKLKWRVSYGLARLVGADRETAAVPKKTLFGHFPVQPAPPLPASYAPTAGSSRAGIW